MRRVALICLLSVCLLPSPILFGQVPDPVVAAQAPVAGVGHHYIGMGAETVNPADGQVSFNLPIQTPAGRGLQFPFGIRFNGSEPFSVIGGGVGGGLEWGSTPSSPYSLYGWSFELPNYTAAAIVTNSYPDPSGSGTDLCMGTHNYVFSELGSMQHSLYLSNNFPSPGNRANVGCSTNGVSSGGGGFGTSASLGTLGSATQPPLTVVDRAGTVYQFPQYSGVSAPSDPSVVQPWGMLAQTITDKNGNQIVLNAASSGGTLFAGSYNDTLGRQVISWSGFGSSTGDQIAIAGLSHNIVVKWTAATWVFPGKSYYLSGSSCGLNGATESAPVSAVSEIDLPNGQKYSFTYGGSWGRLTRITFPDGGYVRYLWGVNPKSAAAYATFSDSYGNHLYCYTAFDNVAITDRFVSYDGVTEALHQQFSYSTTWATSGSSPSWTSKQTIVTTTDQVANQTSVVRYTYGYVSGFSGPNDSSWLFNQIPVEQNIFYQDGSNNTFKTVNKTWADQYATIGEQSILENGQGITTLHCVDPADRVVAAYEYGFQSEGPKPNDPSCPSGSIGSSNGLNTSAMGPLKRQTVTPYHNFGVNILDEPDSVTVYDGTGNLAKQTTFAYTDAVQSSGTAVGLAAPPEVHRGNIASIARLVAGSTSVTTSYTYFDTGAVQSITDACGNPNGACPDVIGSSHTTTYSYNDQYASGTGTPPGQTNAFLTKVTFPTGHSENFTWGYADGLIRSSSDQNSQVTNYQYNDFLLRLTQTSYPDGGLTTVTYNDAFYNSSNNVPNFVLKKLVSGTNNLSISSTSAMDGMGHVVRTLLSDPDNGPDIADTTLDGFARSFTRTNPHRSTSSTTDGSTKTTYDAIGRVVSVLQPDGSIIKTSYSGPCTTVMDEVGNMRQTCTDSLGRLVQVTEPGIGAGPAAPGGGSITINGSEQSHAASAGTGSLSLSTNSASCGTIGGNTVPQNGTIYVTVNGVQSSTGWGGNCSNGSPATPGSVSITINGSEQNKGGTAGTGSISVSNSGANCVQVYPGTYAPQSGTIYVTINGVQVSTGWGGTCSGSGGETLGPADAATVASNLASAITSSSAGVTAVASGSSIALTAKTTGANTNYSVSVTETWSQSTSQGGTGYTVCCSGSLSGGTNGTTDSGTVSVNVNGYVATASYGAGSTAQSVASALVTSLNSSSSVTASASGSTITITSRSTGASTNYSFTVSWTWNTGQFTSPSFTGSPSSGSLSGGSDGTPGGETLQPAIGTLASNLASAINGSSAGVTATASGSTINLVANTTGASTNYSLSTNETYTLSTATNGQGYTISGGSSLTGGSNATTDSGTVSLNINGFVASQNYSSSDTPQTIASGLATALNAAGSPVTSSANGSVITLASNTSGASTNYSFSASTTWNSGVFTNPSFTVSPASGTLTGGSDGSLGTSPLITQYYYNATDDLQCVWQKGTDTTSLTFNGSNCLSAPAAWRPRSFSYDLLSRLTQAINPESGTISYSYDANGNVASKIAPLPNQSTGTVTTNYQYDVVNRVLKKSYVGMSTATASYGYDGIAPSTCTPPALSDSYPLGRQTAMCDGSGSTSWSHDQMGRILTESRNINGVTKNTGYTYNADGSLATVTYPTGRVLTYTYAPSGSSVSAGRQYSATESSGINYVSAAHYAPFGGLTSATLGSTPINISNGYNDRLQPVLLTAYTASATIMSLCYDFHLHTSINIAPCSFSASASGDNGNVYQVVNNRNGNRTQNFAYDSLNRIQQAYTSGPNWGENYTIDYWGNLTNRASVAGKTSTELLNCAANTNNQLIACSLGYDVAGNMTANGSATYSYDAENRMSSGGGCTFTYDGDGQRVLKTGCANMYYWRDATGNTLEEAPNATPVREYIFFNGKRIARRDVVSNTVHYFFSDHLGSTDLVTDAVGTMPPQSESDYYPYGGEIVVTSPSISDQNYKFTGKERDSQTGLDYFGARYNASAFGRFVTPDWAARPTAVPYAIFGDPQSLNLYSFVRNDPVSRADADGHCLEDACVLEIAFGASALYTFTASPQGQQIIRNGINALANTPNVIGSWFHHSNNANDASSSSAGASTEQGRDAQGKFLPKQPGQTQPGADAEKKGLDSIGATKNTKPIPGTNRIPDGKTTDGGQYAEVKSGGSVSNTDQLKEMGAGAVAATGKPLIVVTTNPNVKVSEPAKTNPNLDIRACPAGSASTSCFSGNGGGALANSR